MRLALPPDVNEKHENASRRSGPRGVAGSLCLLFDMMRVRGVLFCSHPFPSHLPPAAHPVICPLLRTRRLHGTPICCCFLSQTSEQPLPPSNAGNSNQSSALGAGFLSMRSVAPSVHDISLPLICLTS